MIKSLHIKNFRCFKDLYVEFGKLTIVVGNNSCGKSTLLSAINLLFDVIHPESWENFDEDFFPFKGELQNIPEIIRSKDGKNLQKRKRVDYYYFGNERYSYSDFHYNKEEVISLTATITPSILAQVVKGEFIDEVNNLQAENLTLTLSKSEKSLTKAVGYKCKIKGNTIALDGGILELDSSKPVSSHKYENSWIRNYNNPILNLCKHRYGKLTTTIYSNANKYHEASRVSGDLTKPRPPQIDLSEYLGRIFIEGNRRSTKEFDLHDELRPYSNDLRSIIAEDFTSSNFGDGLREIAPLIFIESLITDYKFCVLVDEPELHLHPKGQVAMGKRLKEIAKEKQIIATTQSPYLLKSILEKHSSDTKLIILRRGKKKNGKITQITLDDPALTCVSNSPSVAMVTYLAFDVATTELHNELYGYIQGHIEEYLDQKIRNGEKNCFASIPKVDEFLVKNSPEIGKTEKCEWLRPRNKIDVLTLQSFIRNSIHHPENNMNGKYTGKELRASIEQMIEVCKTIKEGNQSEV